MKRFSTVEVSRPGSSAPDVWAARVVDCHQHLWPAGLVEALRRRSAVPRLDGWTLHLAGQPAYEVDPADHDPHRRRALDLADGVDLALLSLSSAIGIEGLPPEQAAPLLAAWHSLAGLPDQGIWAATGLVEPDLDGLAATLRKPRVQGLQVPASAMADPEALTDLAPVLAVVERAGRPVLVHPGPAGGPASRSRPDWWPAMTSYTAQLSAAWFAWHLAGRALLPDLRIAFVALAGLAPLHHERLAQRGGALGAIDRSVFYETSSYGVRAIEAVVRVVGVDPLVHGSDRPYARPTDPGLGDAFGHALFSANPAHLLDGARR